MPVFSAKVKAQQTSPTLVVMAIAQGLRLQTLGSTKLPNCANYLVHYFET